MTTSSFHDATAATDKDDLQMVQADSVCEGTVAEFDGRRFEVMSVRTRGARVALRLSDGTTKTVAAGSEVSVLR